MRFLTAPRALARLATAPLALAATAATAYATVYLNEGQATGSATA